MNSHDAQPVIILGAGGHAKVVAETLLQSGRTVLGVVDPNFEKNSKWFGLNVIGGDDEIFTYSSSEVLLVNGIGALPGKMLRWNIADKMRSKGFKFATVVHPSAIVASDVIIDEGAQVMAGVVIQPGSSIGKDVIVNTMVSVDHDCKIGANCHLAPRSVLSGCVSIGKSVHFGTGSIAVQNISIGDNVVVAAGSIVYEDLESDTLLIQKKRNICK